MKDLMHSAIGRAVNAPIEVAMLLQMAAESAVLSQGLARHVELHSSMDFNSGESVCRALAWKDSVVSEGVPARNGRNVSEIRHSQRQTEVDRALLEETHRCDDFARTGMLIDGRPIPAQLRERIE